MSIAIIGGLDRLKRNYEQQGREMGFSVRFFGRRVPAMSQRLSGVDGIVIFTGKVGHPLVHEVKRTAKMNAIPLVHGSSGSLSGLRRCLTRFQA